MPVFFLASKFLLLVANPNAATPVSASVCSGAVLHQLGDDCIVWPQSTTRRLQPTVQTCAATGGTLPLAAAHCDAATKQTAKRLHVEAGRSGRFPPLKRAFG